MVKKKFMTEDKTEYAGPFSGLNVKIYVAKEDVDLVEISTQKNPIVLSPYDETDKVGQTISDSYRTLDEEWRSPKEYSITYSVRCTEIRKLMKILGISRGGKHKVLSSAPYYRRFEGDFFRVMKSVGRQHTKFNKNVRPKGTHSHFRFYR